MNREKSRFGWRSGARWLGPIGLGLAVLALAPAERAFASQLVKAASPPAPELVRVEQWLNSDGIKIADQKGKVVLLHFWTFDCINCRRNLPIYNRWYHDFEKSRVQFVGVHTPETRHEADFDALRSRIKTLGIEYPVAVDDQRATWNAYENRYWPSIYLIDKHGRVRYRWEGELEYRHAGGDAKVRTIIKKLIDEK